jgi:hypothetical protein
MTDTLSLFLSLRVGVALRDTEGTRQLLRKAATEHDQGEGERIVILLARGLDPLAKQWLANVLGPRKTDAMAG